MLRWVLSIAIAAGILLSFIQVASDAGRVSSELDRHGQQTLALVGEAATGAIFSLDEALGEQVVAGLFEQQEVHRAAIAHPNGDVLASRERPLGDAGYRGLTDWIFGATRVYSMDLQRSLAPDTAPIDYGRLAVTYDTAPAAAAWMERSVVTLFASVAWSLIVGLVLFMVIHRLLTKPLQRIVRALTTVDPAHPDRHLLRRPEGHRGDELDLWVRSTNHLLVAIEESHRKHRDAEERANRLIRYDQLTGLPSRETILSALTTALNERNQNSRYLAVYCCGIDDFKSVNEQLGYQTGDGILQAMAERLSEQTTQDRHHWLLAGRLSSDQFVVIASPLEDQYEAAEMAESLLSLFNEPVKTGTSALRVTATIGVALYPTDAGRADHLLQHAEQTMTLAKAEASNHCRFYVASIDQEIRARRQLEKDLSQALDNGEFHLVYQPQVSLQSNRVIGAEALLRWTHPERGQIPPDQFIPLAELNGTIVPIGQWVLEEACRQAASWASAGMPMRMAVNLSAIQLRQADIVGTILATLGRHEIPPGRLELEVTETGFMENLEDAVAKLRQLNGAGISIAVDDFGTGYSSLTYLKRMPVQHLKIDKQFVQDLLVNEDDTRIANTIIDLGRSLNLSVIAEGVETPEQEFYLRQRGCQLAQGFYFSRPLTPEAFTDFVADFHSKLEEKGQNTHYNR
ncbi:diguanylate cyclase/phosphodiesterase [Marinobacter daqiaonensis]|uniref:cyclic-guanylate-specific phosphodiesterase n=1 Tax=Marinobacter daqiaonensis TaxID=650891 RepID=A0A1I6JF67_9GAMM|nr:GGDEF domain-containing phosphodiesterase [Marinobacter daqiaonensis]SFR77607.1 diguanylate cyclase/phosphodiesterase [Marinobacter daqiaonensis]